MLKGLKYAFVGCFIAFILSALIVPSIFPNANHEQMGEGFGKLIVFVVGIPLFIVGYIRAKKEKQAREQKDK